MKANKKTKEVLSLSNQQKSDTFPAVEIINNFFPLANLLEKFSRYHHEKDIRKLFNSYIKILDKNNKKDILLYKKFFIENEEFYNKVNIIFKATNYSKTKYCRELLTCLLMKVIQEEIDIDYEYSLLINALSMIYDEEIYLFEKVYSSPPIECTIPPQNIMQLFKFNYSNDNELIIMNRLQELHLYPYRKPLTVEKAQNDNSYLGIRTSFSDKFHELILLHKKAKAAE